MSAEDENNPWWHTQKIKRQLSLRADHLRRKLAVVTDPQAKALFETSAEVLNGLFKAFADYETKQARSRETTFN